MVCYQTLPKFREKLTEVWSVSKRWDGHNFTEVFAGPHKVSYDVT